MVSAGSKLVFDRGKKGSQVPCFVTDRNRLMNRREKNEQEGQRFLSETAGLTVVRLSENVSWALREEFIGSLVSQGAIPPSFRFRVDTTRVGSYLWEYFVSTGEVVDFNAETEDWSKCVAIFDWRMSVWVCLKPIQLYFEPKDDLTLLNLKTGTFVMFNHEWFPVTKARVTDEAFLAKYRNVLNRELKDAGQSASPPGLE